MNYLYLISQSENQSYDTFDSAIVCATSEDAAKNIYPGYGKGWDEPYDDWGSSPDKVSVKCIGIANESQTAGTVILASFNAG